MSLAVSPFTTYREYLISINSIRVLFRWASGISKIIISHVISQVSISRTVSTSSPSSSSGIQTTYITASLHVNSELSISSTQPYSFSVPLRCLEELFMTSMHLRNSRCALPGNSLEPLPLNLFSFPASVSFSVSSHEVLCTRIKHCILLSLLF
jgi:hypothetical protein